MQASRGGVVVGGFGTYTRCKFAGAAAKSHEVDCLVDFASHGREDDAVRLKHSTCQIAVIGHSPSLSCISGCYRDTDTSAIPASWSSMQTQAWLIERVWLPWQMSATCTTGLVHDSPGLFSEGGLELAYIAGLEVAEATVDPLERVALHALEASHPLLHLNHQSLYHLQAQV